MNKKLKKILQLFLVFALILNTVSLAITPVRAEPAVQENENPVQNSGNINFDVSLNWNGEGNNSVLNWNATTSANKILRLNVNYSNNNASATQYEVGDLQIRVNGIGVVTRSGSFLRAESVAADDVAAENKTYDWSYSYNETTDEYTFYNNKIIEAESNFNGSFEMLWNLNPRSVKNNYTHTFTATLSTISGSKTSNALTFNFSSATDQFSLNIFPEPVGSTADLTQYTTNVSSYQWVKYKVTKNTVERARGLASSNYCIYPGSDIIIAGTGFIPIEKNGEPTGWYSYTTNEKYFYVTIGYLKSTHMPDETSGHVNFSAKYEGKYDDEIAKSTLSATQTSVNLNDYYFGTGADGKCVDDDTTVNYMSLFNGSQATTFYFNASKSAAYDRWICDDFVDVLLNSGEFRRLAPNEYEISQAYFPGTANFCNSNGERMPADVSTLEIWAKTVDSEDFIRVCSSPITDAGYWVTMPEDTYRIQYRWKGTLTESYVQEGGFAINMIFHLNSENLLEYRNRVSASGKVINLCYAEEYNGNTCLTTGNENGYNGTYAQRNMDRDIAEYGHLLCRAMAEVEIKANSSYYSVDTLFDNFTADNNTFKTAQTIRSEFDIGDSSQPIKTVSSFTQYTVLPKGMTLPSNFNFSPVFSRKSTFHNAETSTYETINNTSLRLADGTIITRVENYIKLHTTVDVIENYKESGRTFIKFSYNFSDNPIAMGSYVIDEVNYTDTFMSIAAKFNTEVPMEAYLEYGETYMSRASMMLGNASIPFTPNPRRNSENRTVFVSVDNGNYFAEDDVAAWSDLDKDENISEEIMYNYRPRSIVLAIAHYQEIKQTVKTLHTNKAYVTGTAVSSLNEEYSYRMKLQTGVSSVENIEFVSVLENTDNAQWQGTFSSINTEYAESLGLVPTVYYADTATPTGESWTTVQPATVKAVRVTFSGNLPGSNLLYILVNMTAPNDNTLIGQITENEYSVYFASIDAVTGVKGPKKSLNSNAVQVKLIDEVGDIKLIKRDTTSYSRIQGATFEIYQVGSGNESTLIATAITDATGSITVRNVALGNYYAIETGIPSGYTADEVRTDFVVNASTFQEDSTTTVVIVGNDRQTGSVTLYKGNNLDTRIPVSGATYSLYRSNGELIGEGYVTNANGQISIPNLPWGSYYFIETATTTGYILNTEKVPFEIDKENVSETVSVRTTDEQKPGSASMVKYDRESSGSEINTSLPVSGAEYTLYRITTDGTPEVFSGRFYTNNNGRITANNLIIGDYYFKETEKATGYAINNDEIHFSVTAANCEAGTVVEVPYTYNVRIPGSITLVKSDELGNRLEGATYTLYTDEDEIYRDDLVTDENGEIHVSDLPWDSYYFLEKFSPIGYEFNEEEIPFEINRSNCEALNVLNTTDNRACATVKLLKVDADDNTILLPGAVYSIYKTDGTLYGEGYTTDDSGVITVEDMPWGSYYFLETAAPAGYSMSSEKVRFSVNETTGGTTIELVAEDEPNLCSVTVTKRIKANDIIWANGNPTFIFELSGIDGISTYSNKYHTIVVFNEAYVDNFVRNNPGEEYVSASATISGLPQDYYCLREKETLRYKLESITNVTEGNTYIGASNTNEFSDCVLFNLKKALSGTATFTNEKVYWSGYSDTDAVINILKTSKKFIGLSVNSNIPTVSIESTDEIDRSLLDVYALYDDGSFRELDGASPTDTYEIVHQNFSTGSYTVEVRHTENGSTKTGTFNINVVVGGLYSVIDVPGGYAITGYNGSSTEIIMPSTINGVRIVQLGDGISPVQGISGVTSLVVPGSVTLVAEKAMTNIPALTNLSIPISAEFEENAVSANGITGFTITTGTRVGVDYTAANGNENVVLPWQMCSRALLTFENGITKIGENQFAYSNVSGMITIPNTVQVIGNYAFAESDYIQEVLFANNSALTNIPNYCFWQCGGLMNVTLSEGITTISEGAFEYNDLQQATLPNSLTTIGNNAFRGTSLMTINLGNGIQTVNEDAFANCTDLSDIYIDKEFNSISGAPWGSEYSNVHWSQSTVHTDSVSGLVYTTTSSNAVVIDYEGSTTAITIPATYNGLPVTAVGPNAFANSNIVSVSGMDNITTIMDGAFSFCNSLETFDFNEDIVYYGNSSFASCSELTTMPIFPASGNVVIGNRAFDYCNAFSGTLTIPSSVTEIGKGAFAYCMNITGIVIGGGISTIPNDSFYCCSGAQSIVINEGVVTLEGAFADCQSVQTVSLPSTVETISPIEFYGCENLTTITINKEFNSVAGAPWMTGYDITTYPTVNWNTLPYTDALTGLVYSATSNDATVVGYTGSASNVTIPSTYNDVPVIAIGNNAFSNNTIIESVNIPTSITSIGNSAFENCENLESFGFNSNITHYGDRAFKECVNLDSTIVFPTSGSVTIGDSAFMNCSLLTGNVSTSLLSEIKPFAFYSCTSLTIQLNFSDNLVSIGYGAFRNSGAVSEHLSFPSNITIEETAFDSCPGIQNVTFNNTIKVIPAFIFSDCVNLKSVTMSNLTRQIGYRSFANCTSLEKVYVINNQNTNNINLPSNLERIDSDAFAGCTSLTGTLNIPSSTTSISGFKNCTGITAVNFANSEILISSETFSGCTGITEDVILPETVNFIGYAAFNGCAGINNIYIYNANIGINANANVFHSNTIIHGYAGSSAETYATTYNKTFVEITE